MLQFVPNGLSVSRARGILPNMRTLAALLASAFLLSAQQPQFNTGLQLHSTGRWDEAIAAFESAFAAGYMPAGAVMYRIARAHSMKNAPAAAADWLARAADAGFSQLVQLQNDADLASARRDLRFGEIMNRIDWNGKPCLTDARYRVFDFWIGEWNVNGFQNGVPQGSNDVVGMLDGCVIMEQWVPHSNNRNRGRSVNYLNPNTGKWHQLYFTDQGGAIEFVRELPDGAMRFEREYAQSGRRIVERLSFTPEPNADVR